MNGDRRLPEFRMGTILWILKCLEQNRDELGLPIQSPYMTGQSKALLELTSSGSIQSAPPISGPMVALKLSYLR